MSTSALSSELTPRAQRRLQRRAAKDRIWSDPITQLSALFFPLTGALVSLGPLFNSLPTAAALAIGTASISLGPALSVLVSRASTMSARALDKLEEQGIPLRPARSSRRLERLREAE